MEYGDGTRVRGTHTRDPLFCFELNVMSPFPPPVITDHAAGSTFALLPRRYVMSPK